MSVSEADISAMNQRLWFLSKGITESMVGTLDLWSRGEPLGTLVPRVCVVVPDLETPKFRSLLADFL
jgi:hypothetical protein